MWSAPALRIWMVLSFGSVTIFCSTSGFFPKGKTANSTSSALDGSSSPPFHTSASMPAGRPPNASGASGSHTRVNVASDEVLVWLDPRLGQAELGPAVRWDQVCVLRVLLNPGRDVGAERENGQPPLPGVVEAEPGQVGGQALALEVRLHLGVDQADLLAAEVVGERRGQLACDPELVAGLLRVVGDSCDVRRRDGRGRDGRFGARWFHGRYFTPGQRRARQPLWSGSRAAGRGSRSRAGAV